VKRSIHAALVAALALSLGPFGLGGARSISAPGPVVRHTTQLSVRVPKLVHSTAKVLKNVNLTKKITQKIAAKKTVAKKPAKGNPVIARRALQVAQKMNTVGWCYKGVCTALNPLGIHLSGAAAYEAKGQLLKDKRFSAFAISGVHDLKPGDILVHGASASHPYGHIAVYVGNRSEASDHVQQVVLNGPYNGTTVFRYGATDPTLSMVN
jgi:hypothetical protein